jgi:hypothetical protein
MKRQFFRSPVFLASIALGVFFFLSLSVSWQESTTMDEKAHIPASYTYVHYLDMRLNPEHPPLLKILSGIPLLFLDVTFPTESVEWTEGVNEQWTLGDRFLHENNAHLITFLSRIPIILLSVLLGWLLFRWTREFVGDWFALGALLLYTANPNIIAHSHYVTTDIGIAFAIFLALYYGVRWLKNPSQKNTLFFGLTLGVAQLIKFSAFLLYPFFGLLTLLFALTLAKQGKDILQTTQNALRKIGTMWLLLLEASLISLLPLWVVYAIFNWNIPDTNLLILIETQLPNEGIPKIFKSLALSFINIPLLAPFTEYLLGLAMVFVRVTGGNTYYFFGEVSNTANPFYFPLVFLIKETLPVLFGLFLACIFGVRSLCKSFRKNTFSLSKWSCAFKNLLQKHITLFTMGMFIFLYSYLSITGNLNIGLRHLFPIIPLLFIFALVAIHHLYKVLAQTSPLSANIFVGCFFFWVITIPIFSYPSYLSYFNESVGGPQNGYLYVTDSNYDWGQDLKNLKVWVDRHNNYCLDPVIAMKQDIDCSSLGLPKIEQLRIDYFGGSSPEYWFGDIFIPWNEHKDPEPGWYALSIGFLQESIYKEKFPREKSYEWLTSIQPIDRAGDSIFIFYIKEEKEN